MASRQFEYQQRHKLQGLCILCSKPRFNDNRCVKHYEAARVRRHRGAVAACCGRLGSIRVQYYLELKRVAALEEAPESARADARDVLKLLFNEEVA